jgi:hypothetical protein
MRLTFLHLLAGLIVFALAIPARAEPTPERPANGIQDNSFLIEEAYNQEAGVVQHILNVRWSADRTGAVENRAWDFAFTQEWPLFGQTHQLSYTVPYSFQDSGGVKVDGIGDVLLNYRLQVLTESETRPAFAPRISLILPTGDASKGLGDDTLGYQFNLPLSKIVSDRWSIHANAGLTFLPDVGGHNFINFNLGASAIYAATSHLNFMLEAVGEWNESYNGTNRERDFSALLSPGVRYAFNFHDAQMVLGLGVPVGVTEAAPDYGVFFYFSFEHRFLR